MHQRRHTLGDDGVNDVAGAPEVDPRHLGRVVRGLQQPGQVDDDVRTAQERAQVLLRDIG